jgi:hypothetical protein
MIKRKLSPILISLILVLVTVTSCAQPTPVVIYVTPTPVSTTPAPTTTATATATATASDTPTATTTNTHTPTVTASPTQTALPATFDGGAIVDGSYVPPVTATPEASATSPATATPDAPPTGTVMPVLNTNDLGIQAISFLTIDDWNEVANQVDNDLQMDWIKLQISWEFFQPNGPGDITEDFRRLEIFVEQLRGARQVKVLLSFAKAPDWARSNPVEDGPPDDPQALANFITLVLSEFNDSVDAVEVWNEPNLSREWGGRPISGADYMPYFEAGYNAVKAYSPNIIVISAGLAPTANTDGSRNDREYLQEMYNAGLARYTDIGVGVHPYGWGNPPDVRCCDPYPDKGWDEVPQFFFLDTLEDYRAIMTRNGHTAPQLWVTEFGWASWDGLPGEPPDPWMTYNSKWDQANYTLRAIELGRSLDYVGPMFLWNLNFAQPILINNRDERVAYSIVLPEGVPRERPLYWMLYDAVRPDEQLERYD